MKELASRQKDFVDSQAIGRPETGIGMNWEGDFLFNQYPDGVMIVGGNGMIIDVNATFLGMTGYEKSDLQGKTMEILMPRRQRAVHVGQRKEYCANPRKRELETGIEPEVQCKDGSIFPADIMLSPLQTEAGMLTVALIRDITKRRQIEKSERRAKETLSAVFNAAPVALFCIDVEGRVLSWSREAERLFGYPGKEVVGRPYKLAPAPDTDAADRSRQCPGLLERVFGGETIRDAQRKRLHKNGSLVDVSISGAPMYDEQGNIYAVAFSAQDISQRLRTEKQLNQLAYFDELTGLPNQACLQKDIAAHFSEFPETGKYPISVAILELEGFREVNDMLGGTSGAKLLKKAVNRLEEVGAGNVKIYHTGRYAFSITIPQCGDPRAIMDIVDPMLGQLSIPFEIDGQRVHIGANAGVAIAPHHGRDVEELLANTSLALSVAKSDSTRNCRFFSMSIRTSAQASRELDINLHRAFESEEFELFFQPQINLASGAIVGAEALLRWRHREHGIIQPGMFINALGKNPIAYDVGKWIMRTAIEKTAAWRKMGLGDLRIGVNLFAVQLGDKIIKDVEDALSDFALPANALELEITENIALGSDKSIIATLRTLKDMGIGIAFDDFGTGYASLSYLVRYPLTRIKIDRSFLKDIPRSTEGAAIVRSLITMSHALGLKVIAEGVETIEHVRFLAEKNCEEAQGYHYSRPIPDREFIEYIRSVKANERSGQVGLAL